MFCEFSSTGTQTVNPGEAIVFNNVEVPCICGLVRQRPGTGNFILSSLYQNSRCPYQRRQSNYLVDFGANIAVPEGQTPGEISVAISLDGSTLQTSQMIVTPAAVEEFFNVGRSITVDIFSGCCETVSIVNTSNIPILVSNPTVNFRI